MNMTKIKRSFLVVLSACVLFCSSYVCSRPLQRVQAVAGVDDIALFVITLLGLSGIYVSWNYFSDSSAAEELVDDFDEAYQEQRLKVIAGGAGAPDPGDEDPDDIPENVNELMAQTLGPNKIITLGALASFNLTSWVIQKAVEFGFFDFVFGDDVSNTDQYSLYHLPGDCAPVKIGLSDYGITDKNYLNRYKAYFNQTGSSAVYYGSSAHAGGALLVRSYGSTQGVYNAILIDLDDPDYRLYGYNTALDPVLQGNVQVSLRDLTDSSWILTNTTAQISLKGGITVTRNNNDYQQVSAGTLLLSPDIPVYIRQGGNITSVAENIIWTTPELQDDFDEHGTITVPTVPSTDVGLATPEALKDLQDAMNDAAGVDDPAKDQLIQNAADAFKDTLINPKPQPGPSPDPGLDDSLTNEQKGLFLLPEWIADRFPFCVPFDIVDAFQHLSGSGRDAPSFTWRLYSPEYGIDYTFNIDLEQFDSAAVILRNLLLILFIISLAAGTRNLIRG